jgi:hypothetical protein
MLWELFICNIGCRIKCLIDVYWAPCPTQDLYYFSKVASDDVTMFLSLV